MGKQQYFDIDQLAIDVNEKITHHFDQTNRDLVNKLHLRVLGVNIDHWGDIKEVSEDLVNEVKSRIPDHTLDEFYQTVADEVDQKFVTKTQTQKLVRRVTEQLLWEIEKVVLDKLLVKITKDVENAIIEKLKKTPEYAELMVMDCMTKN